MEWPGPLARPGLRRCELCGCGRAWQHVRFAPKSMWERSARNEKRSAEVECSVRPYLSSLCPARSGSRTSPAAKGQGHYQLCLLQIATQYEEERSGWLVSSSVFRLQHSHRAISGSNADGMRALLNSSTHRWSPCRVFRLLMMVALVLASLSIVAITAGMPNLHR